MVKFRRAAEAAGWQPAGADVEPVAAPAPEPVPTVLPEPAPAAPAEVPPSAATAPAPGTAVELPPMSADLQARHDALVEALQAAGAAVPADLVGLDVGQLDSLVEDKQARGKCKSALVKFQRAAKAEGWAPTTVAASADEAPPAVAEPVAAPAPVALTEPEPEPEPEEEEEEEEAEEYVAAPMPAALQPLHEAVVAAFAAAGAEPPADPVNVSLDALDELVENKQLRGKCKSALVKFRRAAAAEGWQAGPAPRPTRAKPAAAAAPEAAASPSPSVPLDVPAQPEATPAELFLLTPTGWQKLGTATRTAQLADEIVGAKTDAGATARITSILILDGTFEVPEDLYNTYCYLAHEGVIYKAYYISHIGDVKRGTKTASLKVDQTFTYDEFARSYVAMGKGDRPTADDARRRRFGRQYDTDRRMFLDASATRLV